MRRILLYEYITGGGLWGDESGQTPQGSLLAEGSAMIRALAADFGALPEIEVLALRDRRLTGFELPGCQCVGVSSAAEEVETLGRLAACADATILIAPEWKGELARRARRVLASGGRLISPGPEFIELASDKHRTAEFLRAHGVPAPMGMLIEPGQPLPLDFGYPAVLKPVDGAGSQGVRCVASAEDVGRLATYSDVQSTLPSHFRLEEFCPGTAASVAVLAGPAGNKVLPACRQLLNGDGSFSYLGGKLPLPPPLNERAGRLATACLTVLPAATGYVGFDVVLGADPTGQQDVVIEVNPRLTTSYVGLRALAQGNLAAAWLAAAEGGRPNLPFAAGPIEFRANGELAE